MKKNHDFLKGVKESFDQIPESQKLVAQYIIQNYEQAAFYNLKQLADKIGVSTTTVIRFARSLGLSGYSELQNNLQQLMKTKIGLVERLSDLTHSNNHNELLKKTMEYDIQTIYDTLNNIDLSKIDSILSNISNGETIYVLGMRSSFGLAHYFSLVLSQMRSNVRLLSSTGDTLPEESVSAKAGDVLVVFAFSRYPKTAVNTTRWFKKQKATIITITDSTLSPLVDISDKYLICKIRRVIIKNSMIGPLSLINYLISALASRLENLAEHAAKHEDFTKENEYFY